MEKIVIVNHPWGEKAYTLNQLMANIMWNFYSNIEAGKFEFKWFKSMIELVEPELTKRNVRYGVEAIQDSEDEAMLTIYLD